jgi:TonB family protein
MRLRFVIACAAVAPSLIASSQPVRLQPSSKWVLDYAENSCRLIRTFGDGKSTVKLALESEAPGEMDMLAIGKPLNGYTEEAPAKFLPVQGKPMKGRVAKADTGEPAILWSRVFLLPEDVAAAMAKRWDERKAHRGVRPPPLDLAEEAVMKTQRQAFASRTEELEIEARHGHPVILETGSLGEPIKMFDECSRDSLRDWGVDPDLEDKIARPVWTPDVSRWFSADDYPRDMVVRGEESEVKVRLLVDASGRVTKCTSLSHFKEPEFNQVVCDKFAKRAKFEPAELADGTKVPSYYVNRVVFRMGH